MPSDEITSRETWCTTMCSVAGCDRQVDVLLVDFETRSELGLKTRLCSFRLLCIFLLCLEQPA